MKTLGEILEQLEDREHLYGLLLECDNRQLIGELERMSEVDASDPCMLALEAVRAFTNQADDEAWVKLIGRLQGAPSPAAICLAEMIGWSIRRQAKIKPVSPRAEVEPA